MGDYCRFAFVDKRAFPPYTKIKGIFHCFELFRRSGRTSVKLLRIGGPNMFTQEEIL